VQPAPAKLSRPEECAFALQIIHRHMSKAALRKSDHGKR